MAEMLKPCPFCGSEAVTVEEYRPGGMVWQVGCSNRFCYAYYNKSYLYETRRAATASWNRRARAVSE